MTKALAIAGLLGVAGITWYGYFWLEERRRWGTPVRIDPMDSTRVLARYRGVL